MRILVIGGSLAGLFTAIALQRRGFSPRIHERAPTFGRQDDANTQRGAGLLLRNDTLRLLTRWGVSPDDIRLLATTRLAVRRDGVYEPHAGPPLQTTAWGRLWRVLRECLPSASLRGDARLHTLATDPDDDVVRACFVDSHGGAWSEAADLLVGADGVASTTRPAVTPGTPRYVGYVAWRGVAPLAELPQALRERMTSAFVTHEQPGMHFNAFGIPKAHGAPVPWAVSWVWTRRTPPDRSARPAPDITQLTDLGAVTELLAEDPAERLQTGRRRSVRPGRLSQERQKALCGAAHAELPTDLAALVDSTPAPFLQVVEEFAPKRMAQGRICLVGDAAFVVRPHLAANVAKAAQDGEELATALASPAAAGVWDRSSLIRSLAQWEKRRLALGGALLTKAAAMGDAAHGPPVV